MESLWTGRRPVLEGTKSMTPWDPPPPAVPAANEVLGTPSKAIYATTGVTTPLAGNAIGNGSGGSLPHENRQPFVTVNYIIALFGLYPSQS